MNTNDGSAAETGERKLVLRLVDLKFYRLGVDGSDARHASDAEFLAFASSIAQLRGENLEHWTVEDRRDFLNFCLEKGVLIPGEENILHPKPYRDR
jgi:hypothetical protein